MLLRLPENFFSSRLNSILEHYIRIEPLSVLCIRNSLVVFPFQFELQAACYNEIMTIGSIVNIRTTGCELLFLPCQRLFASLLAFSPLISEVEEVPLFVRPLSQSRHWIPSLSTFAFYLLFFSFPGYLVSSQWLFLDTYSDLFHF